MPSAVLIYTIQRLHKSRLKTGKTAVETVKTRAALTTSLMGSFVVAGAANDRAFAKVRNHIRSWRGGTRTIVDACDEGRGQSL